MRVAAPGLRLVDATRFARVVVTLVGFSHLASCRSWSCEGDEIAGGGGGLSNYPISPVSLTLDGGVTAVEGTATFEWYDGPKGGPAVPSPVYLVLRVHARTSDRTEWEMHAATDHRALASGEEIVLPIEEGAGPNALPDLGLSRVATWRSDEPGYPTSIDALADSGRVILRVDPASARVEGVVEVEPESLSATFEGSLYACHEEGRTSLCRAIPEWAEPR